MRRVLVTGSDGFIGKNLVVRLRETAEFEVLEFGRTNSSKTLRTLIHQADAIVHLAGVNRPADESEFRVSNTELTAEICRTLQSLGSTASVILSSSTQALRDNSYGRSKKAAEDAVIALSAASGNSVAIYRLPGVFGKWCRPNYNSVVATFCHNIAHGLPIQVNAAAAPIDLVYVDDVVDEIIRALRAPATAVSWGAIAPIYTVTLEDLAEQIRRFKRVRSSLVTERVGTGLTRALYSTYLSYLPPADFAYQVPQYADERGEFVELLKTPDSGQVSFFTAHPGITRGGHYHHTKAEKFLVIRGEALFRFRNIITGDKHEIRTSGQQPEVVDTVPGWSHDITNVGGDELVVMLWANEIFDRARPDTIASALV